MSSSRCFCRVLRVSFPRPQYVVLAVFLSLSMMAECIVILFMLCAATPGAAVKRIGTSSALIWCVHSSNFTVSVCSILTTWLLPTPPGPLRNKQYGFTGLFCFETRSVSLHHFLWYITTIFCSLLNCCIHLLYSCVLKSSFLEFLKLSNSFHDCSISLSIWSMCACMSYSAMGCSSDTLSSFASF